MEAPEGLPPLHLPSLGSSGLLVYTHAVRRESVTAAELREVDGLPERTVRQGLSALLRLGLLEPQQAGDGHDGPDDRLTVVPPATARELLLGPVRREIEQLQQEMRRSQQEFDGLTQLHGRGPERTKPVEYLPTPLTVARCTEELGVRARSEVLVCRPGVRLLGSVDGDRPPPWPAELAARAVELRVLSPHSARFESSSAVWAESLLAAGARLRTLANTLPEFVVFDRELALVPRAEGNGCLLLRERALVRFLASLYDRDWTLATPLTGAGEAEQRTAREELRATILRALVNGGKDREIAEQLGISERTCQRHIAEIMAKLGARTRLQAGYLAYRDDAGRRADGE